MRLVSAGLLLALVAGAPPASRARPHRTGGPPDISPAELERGVHDATNGARRRERLGTLTLDAALSAVARRHSADMARQDFFDHTAPDGSDVNARAARDGLMCRVPDGDRTFVGFSENLAQVWTASGWTEARSAEGTTRTTTWRTPAEIVAETVDGWLGSPGHRRNLLSEIATREGIGVEIDADGRVFVTQILC